VNETKPYAGEGGMKKLLARAKLEAEKERADEKDDGGQSVDASKEPKLLNQFGTFAIAAPSCGLRLVQKCCLWHFCTSSSGSSLRVGRQKTSRAHIQRPSKSRFSAVYEDEGDDSMEDDERAKERRMLQEAATKVPVFNIPSGFTFAKDVSCSPFSRFVDCG
jgi:nucleoporin NUP1